MADRQSIVITGASTGIGWGTTKVLLQKGFRVYGTVRRQADADRLQAEFGEPFTPLIMDVTDAEAIARAAARVSADLKGQKLFGLVNNAGIAVPGPLLHLSAEEFRFQLEVNVIGPHVVTQAFAPLLGSDRSRQGNPGRIVQISSVGGKLGVPFLGAYVASKHAMEGMSETLRRELMLYGIDVILIEPGAVVTAIWDKAEANDYSAFMGTDYGPMIERFTKFFVEDGRKGLRPEQLGEAVWVALTAKKPKVRYAVVPQRLKNWTIPMSLPSRMLDKMIGKQLGMIS